MVRSAMVPVAPAHDVLRKTLEKYDVTLIDGGSIDGQDYLPLIDAAGIVIIVVDAGHSNCDRIVDVLPTINPQQSRLVATVLKT